MDPLSITAGVIAVVGLAGKTCKGLYEAIERISEAPTDIQQHLESIQSLRNTLDTISRLEEEGLSLSTLDPYFVTRLQTCMLDLQGMESLAQSFNEKFQLRKCSTAWARVRLSMRDRHRKLKSELRRIDAYHRNFSLDLLLINMRHSLQLRSAPGPLLEEQNSTQHGNTRLCNNPLVEQSGNQADKLYLQSIIWKQLKRKSLIIRARTGPLIKPSNRRETISRRNSGYGLGLAISWYEMCTYRLEVAMYLVSTWTETSVSFQLRWNLSFPAIVPRDSTIFELVTKGDLTNMREQFGAKTSSPSCVSPHGVTLLHVAVSEGHIDTVRFLIENGAQVDAADECGDTPLHGALAISRDYDLCRLLLDNGGDAYNRNSHGQTPLHTFFSGVLENVLNYHDRGLLDFLTPDGRGMTLLHYLAWSSKTPLGLFTRCYSQQHVKPGLIDFKGRSLLHLAAQRGNLAVVAFLLQREDSSIYCKDQHGRTPWDYAIGTKRGAEVSALLQASREKLLEKGRIQEPESRQGLVEIANRCVDPEKAEPLDSRVKSKFRADQNISNDYGPFSLWHGCPSPKLWTFLLGILALVYVIVNHIA